MRSVTTLFVAVLLRAGGGSRHARSRSMSLKRDSPM